jgi:hypothetical protein
MKKILAVVLITLVLANEAVAGRMCIVNEGPWQRGIFVNYSHQPMSVSWYNTCNQQVVSYTVSANAAVIIYLPPGNYNIHMTWHGGQTWKKQSIDNRRGGNYHHGRSYDFMVVQY